MPRVSRSPEYAAPSFSAAIALLAGTADGGGSASRRVSGRCPIATRLEYRCIPEATVVADGRLLRGSFADDSSLFLKGKFFDYDELLGIDRSRWLRLFRQGDWAIFRLTPDKYHYNHSPVSGRVLDCYDISGRYHSCNPGPVVVAATPYSKNKRVVTIIDTEVPGGSRVGVVAMIEIVALMIGHIDQCYSAVAYDDPRPIQVGMMIEKGRPKSLYRPGSSTDVLLFEPGRVAFCEDLVRNRFRPGVESRFSQGFGRALVETDVRVRSTIGWKREGSSDGRS